MSYNESTVAASTTLSFNFSMYLVSTSTDPIVCTLPSATGQSNNGFEIKRIDTNSANDVTIQVSGSDTIDGNLTQFSLAPGKWVKVYVDNSSPEVWRRTIIDPVQTTNFGDGSDGVVTWTTNQTLTNDIFAKQLIISGSSLVINTAGFTINVLHELTNLGTSNLIHNNGSNASGTLGGAGASGSIPGSLLGTIGGGFSGGAGANLTIASGSQGTPLASTAAALGGVGGAGGSAGASTGGSAGVNTTPGVSAGGTNCIKRIYNALTCRDFSGTLLHGGSAGGGGGSASGTASGGGGGGSGGVVVISARMIRCDSGNSLTISATGGNGANASGSGNAGGGGGGGGGAIIIITQTNDLLTNIPTITLDVSGGTHGNGIGTGANGTDGSDGRIQIIDAN